MLIGMAQGPGVLPLLDRYPGLLDYIELPFELLRHDPSSLAVRNAAPIILHCASMSIAGFVPPADATLDAIAAQVDLTGTPWIGEHLAFISADPLPGSALHDSTTLTYTVCPQLSEQVLANACANVTRFQERFSVPLIVENSPQYFVLPGSTMSIVDFVAEFHQRTGVGMLLDLAHFRISALNMKFAAEREILRLPLEQVVEIHVSGLDVQAETAWDDHAGLADEATFDLLHAVLSRARPRAITFEYNWSPELDEEVIVRQIDRARSMCLNA
ncbi:multinuclear non-heme iron-dependent oxidative enzyme ApyH [Bradyrhizobium diazoefficiens]|uniref:multinuclear non-heme iron-dependent oxidative enzyme ApyH n=1 Tax=Bradyrhizobium diazoefficiens TaxID=1355477 RepID=UPI00384B9D86